MSDRPFKTIEEQIAILEQKGLTISDNQFAKESLLKTGYYTLINGYKNLFLCKNSQGGVIQPHHYIEETNFEEIVFLYNLDRELRTILYESLLSYENNLSAIISYRFSENHPEEYSYLNIYNFKHNSDTISHTLKTINSLTSIIERKDNSRYDNAIKHYISHHTGVPLWVLNEFVTFGDLNYFYQNCQNDLRREIARTFTEKYRNEYSLSQSPAIMPEVLDYINHIVNLFRNAVAHNEITYCKKINRAPRMRPILNFLGEPNLITHNQSGIFELVFSLKVVLDRIEYEKLSSNIKNLLNNYEQKFKPQVFDMI